MTNDELILNKLMRLETVLLGVEGTDSRGMAGDIRALLESVNGHSKDIARLKVTMYILAAVTLGTGGTLVTRLLGV